MSSLPAHVDCLSCCVCICGHGYEKLDTPLSDATKSAEAPKVKVTGRGVSVCVVCSSQCVVSFKARKSFFWWRKMRLLPCMFFNTPMAFLVFQLTGMWVCLVCVFVCVFVWIKQCKSGPCGWDAIRVASMNAAACRGS